MRRRRSVISALAAAALGGLMLAGSFGEALAVKASPNTAYCSPTRCEVCVEYEHTDKGDRCVKCEIRSTELCKDKLGAEWTPPVSPRMATAQDDVDVYDRPVKPRKVIGIMKAGAGAPILEYHPHGWCKIDLRVFPFAHDGSGVGWIAQDHLDGCP